MNIPPIIVAGDSPKWRDVPFADGLGQSVDSGSYALQYSIRGPLIAGNLDLVGTAYGTGWAFALTLAQSAALNNGSTPLVWYWQALATKAGVQVTAGSGTLLVKPGLATQAAGQIFDGRSQAEKDLAAVRTEMSARASGGMTVEYTIGSRSLKKEPIAQLLVLEQKLARQVARERRGEAIKNGLGNPGRVGVRFR